MEDAVWPLTAWSGQREDDVRKDNSILNSDERRTTSAENRKAAFVAQQLNSKNSLEYHRCFTFYFKKIKIKGRIF